MSHPRKARLAGLVMAILGVITYGTTSPFGVMLCAEKMYEKDRPKGLRICDWIGLILSVPGCFVVPVFLHFVWNYSILGPTPATLYLGFLIVWTWHRVRIVWGWPSTPRTSSER